MVLAVLLGGLGTWWARKERVGDGPQGSAEAPAAAAAGASRAGGGASDTGVHLAAVALASPDPAREALLALEGVLYAESPPTGDDAREIGRQARAASEAWPGRSDLKLALLSYGESVEGETDVGMGFIAVEARDRWRDEWESLAMARFEGRDWLQGQQRQELDPVMAVDTVRTALDDLERILGRARLAQDRLGEREVTLENLDQPGNKALLSAWRDWCTELEAEVAASAAAGLPRASDLPARAGSARAALGEARFAARRLADPPNPGPRVFLSADDPDLNARYLPDPRSREAWLDDVADIIERARVQLGAAG